MKDSYVFFTLFSKNYRINLTGSKVEQLQDGGWKQVHNPRAVARGKLELQYWLERATKGDA